MLKIWMNRVDIWTSGRRVLIPWERGQNVWADSAVSAVDGQRSVFWPVVDNERLAVDIATPTLETGTSYIIIIIVKYNIYIAPYSAWQQHVSNQSIRERTRQPTASSLLRQRRLRWFGHLHRMPSSLPVRRVFDFNPTIHGWKRPRGRPKTRWADSVKHDLHSAGLDSINAAQLVYDRPQWKAFVCGLPTLEPEHGP